jgi:hypothetical protein
MLSTASVEGEIMEKLQFTIEEVDDDPVESARIQAAHDQLVRNSHWLQDHGAELLPQALGKFVAVAGQEAFVAQTPEEAWAWARKKHPEDRGAFVEYVRLEKGPRMYGNRR